MENVVFVCETLPERYANKTHSWEIEHTHTMRGGESHVSCGGEHAPGWCETGQGKEKN